MAADEGAFERLLRALAKKQPPKPVDRPDWHEELRRTPLIDVVPTHVVKAAYAIEARGFAAKVDLEPSTATLWVDRGSGTPAEPHEIGVAFERESKGETLIVTEGPVLRLIRKASLEGDLFDTLRDWAERMLPPSIRPGRSSSSGRGTSL